MSVLEEIRTAVEKSGKTRKELAEAVGINAVSLSRFMKGHRGLSLETAETLATVLGLELVLRKSKK